MTKRNEIVTWNEVADTNWWSIIVQFFAYFFSRDFLCNFIGKVHIDNVY